MKNNKPNPLDEVKRNILGFGVRNTFRNAQRFVEEIRNGGYIYTDNTEDIQAFLSEEEAANALKKKRDFRYELEDFEIVKIWQYLPEQVVVNALLTCLKENAFQKDEKDDERVLFVGNADNRLSIAFFEYDSDKTEEANYSSREVAEENGCILLEEGFIFIEAHDDYESFAIHRTDDVEHFGELEKEAVRLVTKTFGVK